MDRPDRPAAGPSLTVVVPTRDRAHLLGDCLEALRGSLRPSDELVVVDSAPADGGVEELAAAYGAAYLRCVLPGASRARNVGWRAARHELVGFVDDDVRVAGDWADSLVATFARRPDVAFVTGRVRVPADQSDYGRPVAVCDLAEPIEIDLAKGGLVGHGANLAARRSALDAVGGFDEQLGGGADLRAAEDYDLIDRLLGGGFRGVYEPSVCAVHLQWRTKPDLLRLDWSYGIGAGARVAKLVRTDRRRARVAAGELVWGWGFESLARSVRTRYKLGVAGDAARLAGMAVGFAKGLDRRVVGGHFDGRRRP